MEPPVLLVLLLPALLPRPKPGDGGGASVLLACMSCSAPSLLKVDPLLKALPLLNEPAGKLKPEGRAAWRALPLIEVDCRWRVEGRPPRPLAAALHKSPSPLPKVTAKGTAAALRDPARVWLLVLLFVVWRRADGIADGATAVAAPNATAGDGDAEAFTACTEEAGWPREEGSSSWGTATTLNSRV
jgi:hypothetical protein